MSATKLPDGNFAVASYGEGLLLLNPQGRLIQKIDQSMGLPDNLVIDVWYDGMGSLWLGLNRGIARINYPFDLGQYDERQGLENIVAGMARMGDRFFVTTFGNVYEKIDRMEGGHPVQFKPAPYFNYNINALLPWQPVGSDAERLLLVDTEFLYDWDGDSPPRKLKIGDVGKSIALSRKFPGRVYVGAANFVYVVEMEPVPRIIQSVEIPGKVANSLLEDENGQVWSTDEYILRFPVDDAGVLGHAIPLDSAAGWLPEMGYTGLKHWEKGVTFHTEVGLFYWDAQKEKLVQYPAEHNPWVNNNLWIFEPLGENRLFVWADGTEGLARRGRDGSWDWDTLPTRTMPFTVFRAIMPEGDSLLWIATDDGLFRYNLRHQKDYHAPFRVFVTAAGIGQDSLLRLDGGEVELSPQFNDIRFTFTATEMERRDELRFRYRLSGYQEGWSSWTDRRFAEYTNLSGGNYTFEVMARNMYGTESEVARFEFQVATPWFLRWWAFGLYGLLAALAVWLLFRWRIRALVRARDRLELLVQERTSEIEAQKEKIIEEKQETERQKERAEESERVKKRFFANMTHELRTPLTLILGPVDQLKAKASDPEGRERLDLVERNGKKLLRLINQLLDIAKIESDRMELHPLRRDLASFVRDAVANFAHAAREKGLLLNVHTPESGLQADFDPEKVEKVLFNLLSNAIKFTPKGERIDVRLEEAQRSGEEWLKLEVSDRGQGIPAEDLPHVFDRFYQSEQVRGSRGTGIGLALSKELVELHGGTIQAESVPGSGTNFILAMPRYQASSGTALTVEAPASAATGTADLYLEGLAGNGAKENGADPHSLSEDPITGDTARNVVLVVEDNEDVRSYIRSCIPDTYQVIEAADGKQGLEMALQWVPDLVLTDLMMPEMDGMELTDHLKREEATHHIPVIMLTSRAEADSRLEGLETGADAYLTKPFNPAELQIRIKKLIELRQTLRDKYRGEMLLGPQKVEAASREEEFLLKVQEQVRARLGDEQYSVDDMAEAVGLSRVQFNRKFKALTGSTPNKFLRSYRLDVARQLIEQGAGTMAEIGFQVGFSSAAYFSKCFADEFGISPSEVKRK